MVKFMNENFLLSNNTAVNLYNNYAKKMPIIDYHCHIDPKEIYDNKKFRNITEIWLYGDHYKWRVMRANGIDEKYITGNASDYGKFIAWAKTVPMIIGNPIYNWTHLELQRFFGIYDLLNEKTAPVIWEKANEMLSKDDFRTRQLIKKSNVETICTTDDPVDSLEYHKKINEDKDFAVSVFPTFRPDKGMNIDSDDFIPWIKKLEHVSKVDIYDYDGFLKAIESRIEFFNSAGCKISDHGLDKVVYTESTKEEVEDIFLKKIKGAKLAQEEVNKYRTYTLKSLGGIYSKFEWAMQLHMSAVRNNNTRMLKAIGPNTGFDSIRDDNIAYSVSKILDSLEKENSLPKTILYSLNPTDNYTLSTMAGNFQGDGIPGKIQFGAAWWFNDNKDGMIDQMKSLANTGLLSRFVGMLTDSRSFLSYTRHEYFRRIFCNFIGNLVENGEVPEDMELLKDVVQGVCYNNAKNYFGFGNK
ncbi:MAG: glucuronate isomerase [Clostridium sp.]|uniref:glucuronate isomerase n=1 Tax=Clostridium sp. TaxID=1506 RepID=UPI0025B9A334|nr:glucuronate isomerase [Clostridium sp.]MCH3965922.1 glucuronate isomerase [Clostridium sp.]MCI1715989.1 glucuronate isomerase [Clostridium sp.]MCI1800339.1 glucuronate isomerase [Clostridium sp.]MCI1814166.1 glucuronate isomerase [Clostridium sp.]MCI1871065.1 glucuronate isomerase [Clostridium sp.]